MSIADFSDNLSTLSYVSKHRVPAWLYDPKTNAFLGRNPLNWFLLLLFYFVYYVALTAFFCGLLWIFLFINVPETEPFRTGSHSLLRFAPGLGFRPLLDVQMSLIKYAVTDPQQYIPYTENLAAFLNYYNLINSKPDDQFGDCSSENRNIDRACKFALTNLGACSSENNYGYPKGEPCVIAKLNKIYGWLPDINDTKLSSHVLLSCSGQNPGDRQNVGEIEYNPGVVVDGKSYGYFDSRYFPFIGQAGYLSPLVAMQFKSIRKHVIVLVKCELKNVKNVYDGDMRFEILID